MTDEDLIRAGRRALAKGGLLKLRTQLKLSRNAMADFLSTAPATYTAWEAGTANIRDRTAGRIGRFMKDVNEQLVLLKEDGVRIQDLMPLFEVAGALGMPQELLLKRHNEGLFDVEDLGLLGLWVERDLVQEIGRAVHA